jgi:hypothetical protein
MQVIDAFEECPERQSCDYAQYKAVAERQSGSPEDYVVIVHASHSKAYTNNAAKAYECNQRHQTRAEDAEGDADFLDLLKLRLNFGSHENSFELFAVSVIEVCHCRRSCDRGSFA